MAGTLVEVQGASEDNHIIPLLLADQNGLVIRNGEP